MIILQWIQTVIAAIEPVSLQMPHSYTKAVFDEDEVIRAAGGGKRWYLADIQDFTFLQEFVYPESAQELDTCLAADYRQVVPKKHQGIIN